MPTDPDNLPEGLTPLYRGAVDDPEGLTVIGWAWNPADPGETLAIEVWIGGERVASGLADQPRGDLKDAGILNACCGFRITLPFRFASGHLLEAEVKARGTGGSLSIGRAALFDRIDRLSLALRALAEEPQLSRAGEIAAGLAAYAEYFEHRMPHSVPFSDYESWRALFFPHPCAAELGGQAVSIAVVIDDRDSPDLIDASLASITRQHFAWNRVLRLSEAADSPSRLLGAFLTEERGFLLFLRSGACLGEGAIARLLLHLGEGAADILYADSEYEEGAALSPNLKPAWNYDLFLAQDYLADGFLLAVSALNALSPEDGWDDLLFRAIEATDPGRIGHLPLALTRLDRSVMEAGLSARAARRLDAVNSHLARVRPGSRAEFSRLGRELLRVHWRRRARPTIALLIPTRDRIELLSDCVESLRPFLSQGRLELVIIDNGSTEKASFDYFATLAHEANIRVLEYKGAFNYAAINNWAAAQTEAEIIGLVNNDIVFPADAAPDWLDEIVAFLDRGDVGAVGIKLLYGNGRVQHGGVILGLDGGVAGHAFRQLPADSSGYQQRAQIAQQFSAVTAACLFLRRNLYLRSGGMDETHLPVAFNDVDLCLRLGRSGLRILWTPEIWAYHRESATRGSDLSAKAQARLGREKLYMETEWGALLRNDPAYNPNLNLDGLAFSGLAFPPRGGWYGAGPSLRLAPGAGVSMIRQASIEGPPPEPIAPAPPPARLRRRVLDRILALIDRLFPPRAETLAPPAEPAPPITGTLDIHDDSAVRAMCGIEDCLWPAQSAAAIDDLLSAARFTIDLLRHRSDLRARFPRALSSGPAGGFPHWLVDDESAAPIGLTPRSLRLIRDVFAARLSDRIRQAYLTRQDLRDHFPLALTPAGRGEFLAWLFEFGRPEHGFRPEEIWWFTLENAETPESQLVTSFLFAPDWQKLFPDGVTLFGRDRFRDWLVDQYRLSGDWTNPARWRRPLGLAEEISLTYRHRRAWQLRHPHALESEFAATALLEWLMTQDAELPEHAIDEIRSQDLEAIARALTRQGLNVLGHFCYPSGLRISLESIVAGLGRNGIAVSRRDITAHTASDDPHHGDFDGLECFDISLIHAQPDASIDSLFEQAGTHRFEQKSYRIAYWYWELDSFPEHWRETARHVDEIWVASEFVAASLRQGLRVPVHKLTPGLALPDFPKRTRRSFALPEGKFIFMFAFHMMSITERKNPLALIKAYRQAFGAGEDCVLLIKTSFGANYPDQLAALQAAAGEGIIIRDEILSREETLGLINCCDCYVSLHRSEGYGLSMAEAMMMGKPVIATGYSGNLEFMDSQNSLLVDYRLVMLERDFPPYSAGSRWAEPSIDHASSLMRKVFENPAWAAAIGARARSDIATKFSLDAAGAAMAERLEAIRREHLIPRIDPDA